MYCSQCGNEVPGDARYCPGCGARQDMGVVSAAETYSEQETDQKRKKQKAYRRGRRLGNFLVSAAALLVLFVADGEVPNAGDYTVRQMEAAYFVVQNQKETVICNEKGESYAIDIPQQILYSADHSQMAYVDQDQELYYMKDMVPVFVDDDVRTARLAFYGDILVYLRDLKNGKTELCSYKVNRQTTERVTTAGCTAYAVSPDGKTAAYVEPDGNGTLYLWKAGEQELKIAEEVKELLSVSENGTEVLYRKGGDRLFLHTEKGEQKVAGVSGTVTYVLNEAQTEILYTEDGNTWYYSTDQKEPVRLTGVKGTIVNSCPAGQTASQQGQGLILSRKTLKNMAFATYDNRNHSYKIYRLDREGENAESVLNYADQFQISQNGQSLLYLSGQKLYYMRNMRSGRQGNCISGSLNVNEFTADPGLLHVWAVTPEQELYYVQDEECISLSYDLVRMQESSLKYVGPAGGVLYREMDDLYIAKGEEKVLVKEGVDEVRILEHRYVVAEADGAFWYLRDLKDPVCILDSRYPQ